MSGSAITIANGKLTVPNDPIIPFIEGDGTGREGRETNFGCLHEVIAAGRRVAWDRP